MRRPWMPWAVLLAAACAAAAEEGQVTLNFENAEALSVLEFYSRVTGKAFLPEDDLKARLTVIAPGPVSRKTAIEMLDAVLGLKGYSLVEREDYFKVVRKQIAAREALRQSNIDTPSDRFVTEIIDFKHVEAGKVQDEMKQLLSPEGSLLVNQPLNILIITDTAISVRKIRRLIEALDVPSRGPATKAYAIRYTDVERLVPLLNDILLKDVKDTAGRPVMVANKDSRQLVVTGSPAFHQKLEQVLKGVDVRMRQVLIEVHIVEVSLDDTSRLGVEWQAILQKETGIAGPGDTAAPIKRQTLEHDQLRINTDGLLSGLAGLKYSIIKPNQFKTIVGVFANTDKAQILSTPHLVTLDGKEAKLTVGEEIPVLKEFRLDANNNPIRTFDQLKVGINTAITPRIADNGDVLLAVRQEVSNLLSVNPQDFTYRIGQRLAETNVMIRDGHTLVIGGLIRDEVKVSQSGIPMLQRIPCVGALFRNKSLAPSKAELLIFITPRVIEGVEGADAANEQQQMRYQRVLDVSGEEFRL